MNADDFLNQPYCERQLVAFVPDEVFEESRKARQANKSPIEEALSAALLRFGLKNLAGLILRGAIFLPGGYLGLVLAPTLYGVIKGFFSEEQRPQMLQLLPMTFAKAVRLPPGHPSGIEQVYVGHPAAGLIYYPIADFHRMVFEHKFSELLNLLTSLGAIRIQAHHLQGWKNDLGLHADADVKGEGFFAKAKKVDHKDSSLMYEAELDNKTHSHIPDDLIWFCHENTWQEVARQRLAHGLRKVSVKFEYTDDFGVNAELKAKIEHCNMGLGGEFVKHASTIWQFEVEFRA